MSIHITGHIFLEKNCPSSNRRHFFLTKNTVFEPFLADVGFMTQCKNEGRIQSIPVTKNLTLHRMSKIEFQPDFLNPQMHSFLNMYRVFFLTGPPPKFSKSKIMLKCSDWSSPGPPQKLKVHGLVLP